MKKHATPSGIPTIFLVDDDASVLRAISRVVRLAGWHVAAFPSPREFLEQPRPDGPGCIVLDLTMPGVSGLELQRALAEAGNRLPILFLTGNGDLPTRAQAMSAGAVGFLSKPCPADVLIDALRQALEGDDGLRTKRQETEVTTSTARTTGKAHRR